MSELTPQDKRIADLTLDELAAEAGGSVPGHVLHGRYMAEFAKRQTMIQQEAAEAQKSAAAATKETASFTKASARYILATAIATAVAAAATIFFSAWDHLFRSHP